MKVLFVNNLLYRYGPPIALFRLIQELKENREIEMTLLSYLDGPLRKDYEVLGIRPVIENLYDINAENIKKLVRVIKRGKFDRILVNTVDCLNAVFAAHLCKVPCVLYVHADYPQINTSLLHLFAFKLADRIILPNEYLRSVYAPLIGKTSAKILRNGVPFDRFNPQFIRESKEEILVSNDLPRGKKIVSIIGTVCDRKRQDLLIFAAQEILKQRDDVIFLIIGRYHPDRTYDKLLKKYIQAGDLGSKIFVLDEKENIERYIYVSDVVVNCSDSDVLPNVLIEALALGKPVVAPDIGGINALLKNGHNGVLTAKNDLEEIAEAIENTLTNSEAFQANIQKDADKLKAKYDIRPAARQLSKILKAARSSKKKYELKLSARAIDLIIRKDTSLRYAEISPYVTRKAYTFKG